MRHDLGGLASVEEHLSDVGYVGDEVGIDDEVAVSRVRLLLSGGCRGVEVHGLRSDEDQGVTLVDEECELGRPLVFLVFATDWPAVAGWV